MAISLNLIAAVLATAGVLCACVGIALFDVRVALIVGGLGVAGFAYFELGAGEGE